MDEGVAALANVLIVGGGMAGMTLAIALRRSGVTSEIVEIDPRWTALGVGIALQGPTLRALRTIGLLDECVASGFGYSYFKACDAAGNVTGTVDLPRLNGPNYPASMGVMRQQLHALLQRAVHAAEVGVRRGVTVTSFEQSPDGVAVQFGDGTTGTYDLVVGADGANSKIRDLLFGTASRPRYTGQAVWRATVSRPPEVQARFSFFGPRNKAGFNPVSDDQMYVYLVQNLPEFVRLTDPQLIEVMLEQLTDFGGLIAAARAEISDPSAIVYRPITSHVLPSPWYRGRVLLIGDAAHTATPHMASGAGIAIEDAIVLAELLHSEQSLPLALEKFMTRRYERCRMVVESSFQLGEWEKTPDATGSDPVGLLNKSMQALAQPI
jgi:2-polyprenyl-6-methoxyphenol hydroxylase-like FAD-dependent oxidoreductase